MLTLSSVHTLICPADSYMNRFFFSHHCNGCISFTEQCVVNISKKTVDNRSEIYKRKVKGQVLKVFKWNRFSFPYVPVCILT